MLVFDYAGFMLISCNGLDRHDLQIILNDALRSCYNVKSIYIKYVVSQ